MRMASRAIRFTVIFTLHTVTSSLQVAGRVRLREDAQARGSLYL